MLLLSRQALCDYSVACEAAQVAAEQSGAAKRPTPDTTSQLRDCRTKVIAAEEVLHAVREDAARRAYGDASLAADHRLLITRLAGTALDRLCKDLESSEEEILAAADSIRRLRALLDQLGPVSHDADAR